LQAISTSNRATIWSHCLCLVLFWILNITTVSAKTFLQDSDSLTSDFKQLYIVFAGPYPASPSSAFGHILLVFEPYNEDEKRTGSNPYLWTAVNYAASVEEFGRTESLWYGLTGQLQGSFEILPFYKKIREYSYIDSREIWLFPVGLKSVEKAALIHNLNSRKNFKPYRFTDQNCATEIADVILESIGEEYRYQVFGLPQDILELPEIQNRIGQPLRIKSYYDQIMELDDSFNGSTLLEIDPKWIQELDSEEKSQLLTTLDWLNTIGYLDSNQSNKALINELRLDMVDNPSIESTSIFEETNFKLHKPTRLGFGRVFNPSSLDVFSLQFRIGLHDEIDFQAIYPKYDYLNFIEFDIELNESELLVQEFWLLNQMSRYPKNRYRSYPSWDLAVGGKRYHFNRESVFKAGLFTSIGRTYSYLNHHFQTSIILGTHIVSSGDILPDVIIEPMVEQRVRFSNLFRFNSELRRPFNAFYDTDSYVVFSNQLIFNFNVNSTLLIEWNNDYGINSYKVGYFINIGI
jgi:hypothetical protein